MRKASRGRSVTGDLGQNSRTAGLGVLQTLQNQHGRPLAEHEAVTRAIEGSRRGGGRLVPRGQGGQQIETGRAQRVNHAVGPAGNHHVRVAAADDAGGFADRLRAGGARGERVQTGAAHPEHGGDVAGSHVGLLLELVHGAQPRAGTLRPGDRVESAIIFFPTAHRRGGAGVEIERPFAPTQVNPHAGHVGGRVVPEARVAPGQRRRAQGEARVQAGGGVPLGGVRADDRRQVKIVLHFRRERGRKARRVEVGGLGHAALARQQTLPHALEVAPQGRDPTHSGNDDSSCHGLIPRICERRWPRSANRSAHTPD
jgi:hypothetical protein